VREKSAREPPIFPRIIEMIPRFFLLAPLIVIHVHPDSEKQRLETQHSRKSQDGKSSGWQLMVVRVHHNKPDGKRQDDKNEIEKCKPIKQHQWVKIQNHIPFPQTFKK